MLTWEHVFAIVLATDGLTPTGTEPREFAEWVVGEWNDLLQTDRANVEKASESMKLRDYVSSHALALLFDSILQLYHDGIKRTRSKGKMYNEMVAALTQAKLIHTLVLNLVVKYLV